MPLRSQSRGGSSLHLRVALGAATLTLLACCIAVGRGESPRSAVQQTVAPPTFAPAERPAAPHAATVALERISVGRREPVRRAETPERGPLWSAIDAADREPVHVPYDTGSPGRIVVTVQLEAVNGTVSVPLLFDTGASYTMLSERVAAQLGLATKGASSPVRTPAGWIQAPMRSVRSIAVGAARVDGGLTVGVCPGCAQGEVQGLLGLNFSRHFTVTIDQQPGALTLRRKDRRPSASYDIWPFIQLGKPALLTRGGAQVVRVELENRGDQPIHDIELMADISTSGAGSADPGASGVVAQLSPGETKVGWVGPLRVPGGAVVAVSVSDARWYLGAAHQRRRLTTE